MIQKIPLSSLKYPYLLKQIHNPPPLLYGKGNCMFTNNEHYLCIVGSRECSPYAEKVLNLIIPVLSHFPITIVSGLARGVDHLAHTIALSNNMRCIGVPGSSLLTDEIYPRSSKELAHRLENECNSCLLSSFESSPNNKSWVFPVRNRIMAGLSHALLVIEAKKSSGTLVTASHALQNNREVFCIPGPITSPLSEGTHNLISKGATLIHNPEDILIALGIDVSSSQHVSLFEEKTEHNTIESSLKNITDVIDKAILTSLSSPISHDMLLKQIDISAHELLIHLGSLEIRGYIHISNGVISRTIR